MKITFLEICQFRNLARIVLRPVPGINLLVGKNAQGKTNLLEAIYLLSSSKSFRAARDRDIVLQGKDAYYVKADYEVGRQLFSSVLQYSVAKGKHFRINNRRVSTHHPDRLKTVLFTPEDLYIVKGSAARRRIFFDSILYKLLLDYEPNLEKYEKILKKRNLLLKKGKFNSNSFTFLNDMFVDSAVPVILARINLTAMLEKQASVFYQALSGETAEVKIKYALSFTLKPGGTAPEAVTESLREALEKNREQELVRASTLIGPHRDDINIYLKGRNARTHASQGQQRNLALALKLSETAIVKTVKGYYPVLLLDEVLAELDQERRYLLMNYLKKAGFQTFLSSVDSELITGEFGKVFILGNGSITEEV